MTSTGDSPNIQTPLLDIPELPDCKTDTFPPVYLGLFREFEKYPFNDDPAFKAGLPTVLAAVRGTKKSAAEIDDMIGRAQWFYFTRMKGVDAPWELYVQYVSNPRPAGPSSSQSTTNVSDAREIMSARADEGLTFATLAGLVREGRAGEVEGIKDIPDELNTAPPSLAVLETRRKPWEAISAIDPTAVQPTTSDSELAPAHVTNEDDQLFT